ncbi:uroporphyrinogen III methyltransferase [Iodidimonas nitroreducens]|uniref:Uroporphyrinogen III methyltransferase n=1 Tax=Iodidimonas nitroreducens TaxID=1236968 RepID=A0A5A7N3V1_9PROT|nr:uroporphyrinogen-III synthase [Iodidimonas nitroreducens]GAK34885.1 uroporphyrinogen-III synthase [alpha proteobacterium Q-1]GER02375.1 uroporphyrinogen III methyltransferase [Iodidimonas nitroreducens]
MLTRPVSDQQVLAATLQAMGHQVIAAPVMEVHWLADEDDRLCARLADHLAEAQGLIFTSGNGVRALQRCQVIGQQTMALPVFTTGTRTADLARGAGFSQLRSADGDGQALAHMISQQCQPAAGALVHPCGVVRKDEPAQSLAANGFTLRQLPIYDARPVPDLSDAAVRAFAKGDIDLVLLYSARSARLFFDQMAASGLDRALLAGVDVGCLSDDVAHAAEWAADGGKGSSGESVWRHRIIARQPDEASLLRALTDFYDQPFGV